MRAHRIKSEMHQNLDEQRHEYQRKMEIIEEIKREKELREKQIQMKRELK